MSAGASAKGNASRFGSAPELIARTVAMRANARVMATNRATLATWSRMERTSSRGTVAVVVVMTDPPRPSRPGNGRVGGRLQPTPRLSAPDGQAWIAAAGSRRRR